VVNLKVDLCGRVLRNPIILAAGILGLRGETLKKVVSFGVGAVTTKSIGRTENLGYRTPNLIEPCPGVVLNAMGLPNPGYTHFKKELSVAKEGGVPVIVSIYGSNAKEFRIVSKAMEKAGADMVELNISCPHPKNPGKLIGQDAAATFAVVKAVKEAIHLPVIAKLTPNVTDIKEIASAAIEAGCDAISAINTVKALYIDIDRKAPVLSNKVGGMSGWSVKPIAVRCVAEVAMLVRKLEKNIPIIGIGGVYTGRDVIEMMMAGATCVGVGTAVLHHGPEIFQRILQEFEKILKDKGYNDVNEIIGCALRGLKNASY
jgi:dihydroorotate dehydrogenase (NAD+) catalytic subunit